MDLKRTIEELVTMYGLEPDLRDAFVEGFTDQAFFRWYARRKHLAKACVYSIDLVDISDALLDSHGLPKGSNRSKVIALALEFQKLLPSKQRLLCIVDRDTDDASVTPDANPYLCATDGNALELYAYSARALEKFLLVCLGGFPLTVDRLLDQITPILLELHVLRRANIRLQWGMKWIPFHRFVQVTGTAVGFRKEDFIKAYLLKNNRWQSRGDFARMCEVLARTRNSDPRCSIRGHDVSELLLHILRTLEKTRAFGNPITLEGCLMTAVEVSDLDQEPLFKAFTATLSSDRN